MGVRDAFCSVVAELEESKSGSLGSLLSCCWPRAALQEEAATARCEAEMETDEPGDTSCVGFLAFILNPVLASYVITVLLT